MAKVLVDANVILRYLINDDEDMAIESEMVIKDGACTLPEVLAEVVYVLRSVYKVERKEIADKLLEVLEDIEIEHHNVMIRAIEIFSNTNLDFVDCVLIAYHEVEGMEIFSFDKKLNNRIKQVIDDK